MASSVIKKANARLKFLYRKRDFLTHHTKKLLVMALIQCHFDYACSFWYHGLTKYWKDKLQVTQNKLIRFVLNLEHRSHIDNTHFRDLNWLPVNLRVEQICLVHVFKITHGLAPEYMDKYFIPLDTVHTYRTRSRELGDMFYTMRCVGMI